MEINDIDYDAVFGLSGGEKEQEPAEPAEDRNEQGEKEQEPAEPAEREEKDLEERAKYAAARRKAEAERDAAIAQARQEAEEKARKEVEEIFRSSGMKNPYTGKPITSKAEYDDYLSQHEGEQRRLMRSKSGMSEEEFAAFISSQPEVREAMRLKSQAEAASKQAQEEQAERNLEEQLRQIGELDPSIHSLDDLAKMESYPEFYALVQKGNSLVDAFKLVNFDALTSRSAAAGQERAMRNAQSKQHLRATQSRGGGGVTVPQEVKEMYRNMDPNITEAEMQSHYGRYVKG